MKHRITLLEDDNYDKGEPEYDFAELRRSAAAEGREYRGQAAHRLIRPAPDVASVFRDEEAVNRALRELIVAGAQVGDARQPASSSTP